MFRLDRYCFINKASDIFLFTLLLLKPFPGILNSFNELGFLAEGVSKRILAINDTYMINTVVIVVKHFGTSSKHLLL